MNSTVSSQIQSNIGNPRVTVIIPCYNAKEYIGATLESVLAQTMPNFEIIVVDDKSTDASVRVIHGYVKRDSRIRLIEMPSNAGAPAGPRNAGVCEARSEWVAFLDADDLWHPQKLELQLAIIKKYGADMCSTQMKDFWDQGSIVIESPPQLLPIQQITFRQQLLKYRTPTSSILIRRELIQHYPFNEDPGYKAREDTDCFIRIHEHIQTSVKIKFPLIYYRQQSSQISGNKWKMVGRHFSMLNKYRLSSGRGLGLMAYVYTFTHFLSSIYLRLIRRTL